MSPETAFLGMRKAAAKVRQACDTCHTRKIRCDGRRPCMNCRIAKVDCTYCAIPKKTGPKGPRYGRRPDYRRQAAPAPVPQPGHPEPGVGCNETGHASRAKPTAPVLPRSAFGVDNGFQPSPQVSADMFRRCLDAYFKHKYPITPMLDQQRMEECVRVYPRCPESYGLLMSCCANIALDPDILSTPADLSNLQQSSSAGINLPSVDFFLSEALRSRRYHNVADTQSLAQVQTSFFLYCIYFCLNNDNAAWFYIREAMTILQTLRYHEEATYNEIADASTKKYARRIFWVLFNTERAYAMQRHRPLTLQPVLDLPQIDPLSPDAKILPGFLELISLFRPFDTDFIATWNSSTPSSTSKSAEPEQLARLQNTLSNALANVSNFSPMQQADLLITREWLKVIVWKLCVARTLLSGTDSEDSMSLSYPTTIARDTVLVSRLLPTTAFEANGVGILEKVFDVGCSLADLLSLNPPTIITSVMDVGPIDILMETVRIAGQKFGDGYKHLDILVDKANFCLLMNVDRSLPLPADTSLVEVVE